MKNQGTKLVDRLGHPARLANEPRIHPTTESIKVWLVRVQATKPKYYLDGKVVEVGQKHDLSLGEARDMVRAGKVEIVGEPYLHDTKYRVDDTPPARLGRSNLW